MVIFHKSRSSAPCHPQRTYGYIQTSSSFHSDLIQYQYNYTLGIGEVFFILFQVKIILTHLGGLALTFDMAGMVKNIRVDSYFGLQVILLGYLGVSDPCIFQKSCVM